MSDTVITPARVEPAAVRAARERLDAHVREIVRWHFDPATGCPFWLEKAREFGFDPRGNLFEHLYARRSFQQSADAMTALAAAHA